MLLCFPRIAAQGVLFLFLALFPLNAAFGDFSWAIRGGILFFGADNGPGSDPAPILPSLGASVAWQISGLLRIEVTEDIYIKDYEYNTGLGYAMACNPENRAALVIGLLTGVQATAVFPVGDNGTIFRVYGGPAIDLRIVALAAGLNHPSDTSDDIENNAQLQTEAIAKYLWGEGRWFLPVIGAGMDFPISEKFLLGFDIRIWLPLYRLSADKDLPAIDGWRFGVGFRITPR
jgi:hypothetical protein